MSYNTSPSSSFVKQIEEVKRKILLHGIVSEFPAKIVESRLELLKAENIINLIPYGCVLTGSVALYLYGLIDRKPLDYDIISTYKNSNVFHSTTTSRILTNPYDTKDFDDLDEIIHYRIDNPLICDIDFFIKEDYEHYTSLEGLNIDNLANIVEQKSKIGRRKDLSDLVIILDRLTNGVPDKDTQTSNKNWFHNTSEVIKNVFTNTFSR